MSKKKTAWDDDFGHAQGELRGMSSGFGGYSEPKASCYHSHPPLKITLSASGEQVSVYGGNARAPIVKDADIYVDLAGSSQPKRNYPWNPPETGPVEIVFPVYDMEPPSNPAEFKKMVYWLGEQVIAGKKLHVGCLGGHGRTGTLLAALVKVLSGEEDAITYVRENYCQKAVESDSQVKFLNKYFDIKAVDGYKSKKYRSSKHLNGSDADIKSTLASAFNSKYLPITQSSSGVQSIAKTGRRSIKPTPSSRNVWIAPKTI